MATSFTASSTTTDISKRKKEAEAAVKDPYSAATKAEEAAYNSIGSYDSSKNTAAQGYLSNITNATAPTFNDNGLGALRDNARDAYVNREAFNYDVNTDALYQQYKDMYMSQGRLAMNDTIGKASAMTGGYGNSYAASAGNIAYQQYLGQLNSVVPELYQLAYSKYQDEGEKMLNNYNLYNADYNTAYGQYRDAMSDYNTDRNYNAEMYQYENNLGYNQFYQDKSDAYNKLMADKSYDYESAWQMLNYLDEAEGTSYANDFQEWYYNVYLPEQQAATGSSGGTGGKTYKSTAGSTPTGADTTGSTPQETNTTGGGVNSNGDATVGKTEVKATDLLSNSNVKGIINSVKPFSEYVSMYGDTATGRAQAKTAYNKAIKEKASWGLTTGKISQIEYQAILNYFGIS